MAVYLQTVHGTSYQSMKVTGCNDIHDANVGSLILCPYNYSEDVYSLIDGSNDGSSGHPYTYSKSLTLINNTITGEKPTKDINYLDKPYDAVDNPVNYAGEANAQALINVSKKRLCHQASNETRTYMEDLKTSILIVDRAISDVMVPSCIYRGGCPEMQMCSFGLYPKFLKFCLENNLNYYTIQQRYDAYNLYFHSEIYKNQLKKEIKNK